MIKKKKICVIGSAGYIGLPLAVLLAQAGHDVLGVDINNEKIQKLSNGICTLEEKGMDELYQKVYQTSRLRFSSNPELSDVYIIAVPTPLEKKTKAADLSFIESALSTIIPLLREGNLVILESTIPPLTCRNIVKKRIERETKYNTLGKILIAHCPERAFPGNLLFEFTNNDRIIGGVTKDATKLASEIYGSFSKGKIHLTDDVTAESVKLAENTYRDINIAYANELKLIFDNLNINVKDVIKLANFHPRVNILNPGIGVGGHCIAIDPWFLWKSSPNVSKMIPTARKVNNFMPEFTANQILNHIKKISSKNILIVGKSYKPDVNDKRESPALEVVKIIEEKNPEIRIKFIDPLTDNLKSFSLLEEAKDMDMLIILVSHSVIKHQLQKNYESIVKVMRMPEIIQF